MIRVGIITVLDFEAGTLDNDSDFVVRRCGVAGAGADTGVQELAESGCRLVVSWGTAGALSPRLKAGDLCLPEAVLTREGVRLPTDTNWRTRLSSAVRDLCPVRFGVLLDSPVIVCEPAEKAVLADACGALAVDMESGPVAKACARRDLPFLVVRSIIDEAGDSLPDMIGRHIGRDGALRAGALLVELMTHPNQWVSFARLMRRYSRARATLLRAATALAGCGNGSRD